MMGRRFARATAVLASAWMINCSGERPSGLPGDAEVLAKIAGRPVTRYDLEFAAKSTLGALGDVALARDARQKLLDGLVRSRAIAVLASQALTPLEVARIEKRASAFRERLLVRAYVEKQKTWKPPTEEEVREFYEKNAALFGAGTERIYELLSVAIKSPSEAAEASRSLGAVRDVEWKDQRSIAGQQPRYHFGELAGLKLPKSVGDVASRLSVKQASEPVVTDEAVYLVRLVDLRRRSATPYPKVRDSIFQRLKAQKYKRALQAIGGDLQKRIDIEYLSAN